MKRCLTPLAALLLAFALCLPAHAASCSTALTRTSGAGGSGEILAPFTCGGNLYALCRSGIFSLEGEKVSYALNPAPDGAVELAQPFSWQGETAFVAYNLRQDAEEIEIEGVCLYTAAIDPAGGLLLSAELPLNGWEDFETEYAAFESLPMPSAAVALKNQLFFSFPQEYQTRIVVADADSGECEILILDGNVHILPFQEDRLLTYETQSGAVGALSVEDHAHSALGSLPAGISGMHYHPAESCLFYVLDGELYAASGDGSAAPVCALPISQSNAFSLLCMEDILYISDGDLLLACDLLAGNDALTGRICVQDAFTPLFDRAYLDFTQSYPHISVERSGDTRNFLADMLNQSSDVDVYVASVGSGDYQAAYERGYLLDLSSSDFLQSSVTGMYPEIQKWTTRDGALLAVPVSMNFDCLAYNPAAFERIGLAESDVPQTWEEFFALLAQMPALLEAHPDVRLFDNYTSVAYLKEGLLQTILRTALGQVQALQDFETISPALCSALDALDAFDFAALTEVVDGREAGNVYAGTFAGGEILFSSWGRFSASQNDYVFQHTLKPLMLKLQETDGDALYMDLTVAFVNPYSQQPDAAIAYLESLLRAQDGLFWIHTCPAQDAPLRQEGFEERLASYETMLENDLPNQIAQAAEEDIPRLESLLAETQAQYEEYLRSGSYVASPESIARYKAIAGFLQVAPHLSTIMDTYGDWMQQYLEGTMDIREFENRLRTTIGMMIAEG